MLKNFIKNSFIYTVGAIFCRGINFFLIPFYTRIFSPREYGVIDFFTILASIIQLTIALEITQAVARYYQEASDENKASYTSTAFWFSVSVYGVYFFISFIFGDYLTELFIGDLSYRCTYILASLSIATGGLFYFSLNQLKWEIKPKKTIYASSLSAATIAIIVTYFLIYTKYKTEGVFIAQTVGNLFGLVLAIYWARGSYAFVFHVGKFKRLISFSYPLVISGIGGFFAMYADRIFIKAFLGSAALGIYGAAYRISSIVSLILIGFQSSITPLIYKHYKEVETPKNISKLFSLFIYFSLVFICGSLLFSEFVIKNLVSYEFFGAENLVTPLVASMLFSTMYLFSPGLGIQKKTRCIAYINIVSATINIIFNIFLIPYLGILGSAVATLISSIFMFVFYFILGNRLYVIPYQWSKIFFASLFSLSSSCILNFYYLHTNGLSLFIKVVVYIFICAIASLLMFGSAKVGNFIRESLCTLLNLRKIGFMVKQ